MLKLEARLSQVRTEAACMPATVGAKSKSISSEEPEPENKESEEHEEPAKR